MDDTEFERAKKLVEDFARILRGANDVEVGKLLLRTGSIDTLFQAILDPRKVKEYPTIGSFLLANKQRATALALMRHVITNNYSFKGSKSESGYVSPNHAQWFEDGVMLLEGKQPFEGFVGLFRNGEVKYAIAARDARAGEDLGPESFEFISLEDFNARLSAIPISADDLEKPVMELKHLLAIKESRESEYQGLLQKYPWILGAHYRAINNHSRLDDANIPDFTGVRVKDGYRDIFEIKQPFAKIFRKDLGFAAEFNEAWNQAERYINFAREEGDYLRRKGLLFDNPRCCLLIGFDLSDSEVKKIRA